MARTSWRDRPRSWFDRTMDRGTPALIGWLGLASLALIVVVSGLAVLLTPGDRNVNPPPATPVTLTAGDSIVVVAED